MILLFLQGCCSDAEVQQAGRFHTTSQPIQCELPTIPVQIGSHLLRGVSFNESASDNLKLKTVLRTDGMRSQLEMFSMKASTKIRKDNTRRSMHISDCLF